MRRRAALAVAAVLLAAGLFVYASAPVTVTPATMSIAGVRAMLTAAVADIHGERFDALCDRYVAPESELELQRSGGCASLFKANWASDPHHGVSSQLSAIYLDRITLSGRTATFYSESGRPEGVGALYVGGHWHLEIAELLRPHRGPRVPEENGRLI